MRVLRALTIGSAMVDIIVLVASRSVERVNTHNATSSFLLLEQGRKIEAESITPHVGGYADRQADLRANCWRRPIGGLLELADPDGECVD